jgi:hypothetical protein
VALGRTPIADRDAVPLPRLASLLLSFIARSLFFDKLIGRLLPLFEGVAEPRFIRNEATDRLVIFPAAKPELITQVRHAVFSCFFPTLGKMGI